jgi:hypothetical protein
MIPDRPYIQNQLVNQDFQFAGQNNRACNVDTIIFTAINELKKGKISLSVIMYFVRIIRQSNYN